MKTRGRLLTRNVLGRPLWLGVLVAAYALLSVDFVPDRSLYGFGLLDDAAFVGLWLAWPLVWPTSSFPRSR